MGELLGIPEWLAMTLLVVVGLATFMAWGFYSIRKAHRRLAEKRPNPTREEFLEMMCGDVDEDVADWMWERLQIYYRPLDPHPDDHLLNDARIDDDDVDLDWIPEFAEAKGLGQKDWPDWPQGWDLTVRNFARFLQLGRASQEALVPHIRGDACGGQALEPPPQPRRYPSGRHVREGDRQPQQQGQRP